jgi:hypothetical protein
LAANVNVQYVGLVPENNFRGCWLLTGFFSGYKLESGAGRESQAKTDAERDT